MDSDPTKTQEEIARLERLVTFLESLGEDEFVQGAYAVSPDEALLDDMGISFLARRDCRHCTMGWARYHYTVVEGQDSGNSHSNEGRVKKYYGFPARPSIVDLNDDGSPQKAVSFLREHLEKQKALHHVS